jgi:plasmid maintenance system antidote protein VapI
MMKKRIPEPWAIDVRQRLIPLGVERQVLADRIKVSRGHLWACLNGQRVATERTKAQIIKAIEEMEAEAWLNQCLQSV